MTLEEAKYILAEFDSHEVPSFMLSAELKRIVVKAILCKRSYLADSLQICVLQEEIEENLYAKASV